MGDGIDRRLEAVGVHQVNRRPGWLNDHRHKGPLIGRRVQAAVEAPSRIVVPGITQFAHAAAIDSSAKTKALASLTDVAPVHQQARSILHRPAGVNPDRIGQIAGLHASDRGRHKAVGGGLGKSFQGCVIGRKSGIDRRLRTLDAIEPIPATRAIETKHSIATGIIGRHTAELVNTSAGSPNSNRQPVSINCRCREFCASPDKMTAKAKTAATTTLDNVFIDLQSFRGD